MRKDEEIERTLRVYSKSGAVEYVPRSKKEDDYVVARPVKVPKCAVCGSKEPEPFECEFCHQYYCEEHLSPEKHECPSNNECPGKKKEKKGRKKAGMSHEEEAAIKRAIVARMENMIGRLPAVYMLIDCAGPDELKEFLKALETMENVLNGIASRDEE